MVISPMKIALFVFGFFFLPSQFLGAAEHAAKLVRFVGDVKVLTEPNEKKQGEGPYALYEGKYYRVLKPRVGMSVSPGDIVQTGSPARARLIFDNGDQVTVSSQTFYRLSLGGSQKTTPSTVDVVFGKLRMMVKKGGARSGMEVRTRTMVMGVRGTDFFVTANPSSGGSMVTVLRGQVVVTPNTPNATPIEVPAGYAAQLASAHGAQSAGPQKDAVAIKPVTTQELVEIQKETKVPPTKEKETAEDIKALEKKAVEATVDDMKQSDPDLFERMKGDEKVLGDIENLNTLSVKRVFDDVKKGKPSEKSLESDEDVYKKYFRME